MEYKWKGSKIEKPLNGWYNISTKRIVTKNNRKDLCYFNDYICGNDEDIKKFKTENNIGIIVTEKVETLTFFQKLKNKLFKIRHTPLTQNEKDVIDLFILDFSGVGEIVKVTDGDTYHIRIFVHLKELKTCVIRGDINSGFYAIFKCRLYGIDVAEKNTYEGQYAKNEIEKMFKSYDNIVYFIMKNQTKKEKFGRQLVELYTDENFTFSYSKFLLDLTYINGNKVALPYNGDKKDDYLKNLPRIRDCPINLENDVY